MTYPILRMSALAAALLLAGNALAAPQAAPGTAVAATPRADRWLALDTDGDGRISKLEAQGSRLAERFAEVDLNKDGYLVRSELQADRDRRRAESSKKANERFEQRFTQADSNGDGRLSRAEFETAWPGKAKMFAFLDEDRDGYLKRADLAPARGR